MNDRETGVLFQTGTKNFLFSAALRLVLVALYALSGGYQGLFPGGEATVPRLRMHGAIPSLPHTSFTAKYRVLRFVRK
jgi:hypothetical protein